MAGKVGMEEALMEMTRMSLTVQFAVTIMNQGVTTFKEIQQIQV
jgi:flagellar hook-basal body complex protein FliE